MSIQSFSNRGLLLNDELDINTNETKTKEIIAPNGTQIQLVKTAFEFFIPATKQFFILSKMNTDAQWVKERTGMNLS